MRRHGHLAIFYARFLAGARALVYVTAGSIGFDFSRFFIYDALGALISVPIVVTLGYLFGPQIEHAVAYVGGFERLIWLVAVMRDALSRVARVCFACAPAIPDEG